MRDFIGPDGRFRVYQHQPSYRVRNLRRHDGLAPLGYPAPDSSGQLPPPIDNRRNFPAADLVVDPADPVYEIPNPFPFRGTTFICQSWAAGKAADPGSIRLPRPPAVSLRAGLGAEGIFAAAGSGTSGPGRPTSELEQLGRLLALLPRTLRLTLAATSHDPAELVYLAALSCEFVYARLGGDQAANHANRPDHSASATPGAEPVGLRYHRIDGQPRPLIHDHDLYETVANNPHLPVVYRQIMVLRPGAQGGSEIVGEYGAPGGPTHIFEYLRRNSYIPWGHYAANMADDAIRYRISDLSEADMTGLRHLYYQRTYIRLAEMLQLPCRWQRTGLTVTELEDLRRQILPLIQQAAPGSLPFTATLWGWNFGYDLAGSGFRLHASHQQVHQQYALVPPPPAFACGDQVAHCGEEFRRRHGRGLFAAYLTALRRNTRIDGNPDAPADLIIHEDEQVILFVPKAQVSQWELQIMAKGEVGNIMEADHACRAALDGALLRAQRILAELGATLVTSIEYAKRLDDPNHDQRLLYALLPKLPYAMGAFSEAQQRWICGHYPEDFAAACRAAGAGGNPPGAWDRRAFPAPA